LIQAMTSHGRSEGLVDLSLNYSLICCVAFYGMPKIGNYLSQW
jgi:hypothetical protein